MIKNRKELTRLVLGFWLFWLVVGGAMFLTFPPSNLPQVWVNSLEYLGRTTYTINFPSAWACGSQGYGPYTAASQASLNQAIVDAETCRTVTGFGTQINIPPVLYSGPNGINLPQTAGDNSTAFIILTSTTPLPTGVLPCAHGIQDNNPLSTQPGLRNLGCTGTSLSYQLGTSVFTVPAGSFTFANGKIVNTSQYNDVASMWTAECTGNNCNAVSTATWDCSVQTSPCIGVGPHHYAILNAELRPQAGLTGPASPLAVGQNTETVQSELPTDIHISYSYLHGDWTDAPMSGCPSACVATSFPTGSNSLPALMAFNGCVYCSATYVYGDRALRPGSEGHGISALLAQQMKYAHNWIEGQSIGKLCGGFSNNITLLNFVTCQDEEDRANRYTYPYSWMLAESAPILRAITKTDTGRGVGYLVNDVITVVQAGASGGTGTVTSVGAGGTINSVAVLTVGTGYTPANGLSVTGGSGTGGQVNILGGYLANGGNGSYVRKNAHEYKFGERVLEDGNIYENVDVSGAQFGTVFSHKTAQNSSGILGTNYWTTADNFTVTNIIARNACNGPSFGDRSDNTNANGGGVSLPTQIFNVVNNLYYNLSSSVPGCAGAVPGYGWRIASSVPGNTWAVTALRDSAGLTTTLTLTASPGEGISNMALGDPVVVIGCTDTSFNVGSVGNTGTGVLGPPALTGTLMNGLTVVYSNPGTANAGAGVTGCVLSSAQGWPDYMYFAHLTVIADPADPGNPTNSANGGANIWPMARNFTATSSILVSGGQYSTSGEGKKTQLRMYDPTTESWNNLLMPGRDGLVVCPGHTTPAPGGMAACYNEYSSTHVQISPPTTLYGTPTVYCSSNDPTVGNCSGILGIMSTLALPLALPDWHNYRLCHTGDLACNSKPSLYSANQIFQAPDGTDLGMNPSAIDAAQVSIQYTCTSSCGGTGPFPDVLLPLPTPAGRSTEILLW